MNYKGKYIALVNKIHKAHLYAQTDSTRAVLEEIRPELKESGDEEVRKAMIDFFKHEREEVKEGIAVFHYGVRVERMIAWLEKRGEQKPAWSEEDEQYLLVCKNALVKYQTTNKWDTTIISRWLEDKLKSIKGRVGCEADCTTMWKPSGEQMKYLWKYAEQNNYDGRVLTSLFNDLKKLREV